MSDSLIEQVRKLAEAQREADETERLGRTARGANIDAYSRLLMRQRGRVCFIATEMDAPALLAHMQAQQAVVDAANTRKFWEGMVKAGLRGVANGTVRPETLDSAKVALDGATIALDAALEKVNDHEQ